MSALPEWASAHGDSLFEARIRAKPSDFVVTEQCDIEFSGDGEHDFLWIEKTGNNTHWVAERLAKHGGVPVRDIGFAGMKDRHAITRQWFSVRRLGEVDWQEFAEDGVEILEQQRHYRKLRRGAHTANTFRIVLRADDLEPRTDEITRRLESIAKSGVPNYFGEQRFGRNGSNIELCKGLFAGRRLAKAKRGIALSAARSLLFNAILDARVRQGSWNQILPGELANLNGSGSIFSVDVVTDELVSRCAAQDIHPSGSLWGDGSPLCGSAVAQLEAAAVADDAVFTAGLVAARMQPASRALRLLVSDLRWELQSDSLCLEFGLTKGAYATAVLREIASVRSA